MSWDVLTLGEAMLRLSVPPGSRLVESARFDVHVAGAEVNTSIALAALGREVTWLSRLPDNPLGRRVASELISNGVDTTHVQWVDGARLGVYYVELTGPPRAVSVVYDRASSAAADMGPDDFDLGLLESARVAHITGITPALSDTTRELSVAFARRSRESGCRLTVDINYRAKLWPTDLARKTLLALAAGAHVVVMTREDARDVFGLSGEPDRVAAEARAMFEAETIVLTLGDQGSIWDSDAGKGRIEALPASIVDRLGAGDAFMAGVIEGVLTGDMERGLEVGTILATLALGTHGDHVVTTRDEVMAILGGRDRTVDR